ncbi:hypothetical protein BH20CHL7_BH20CHL7_15720 [soil metagenome]
MAILAALLAFGSRFAGKVLTTALGWASTLLFGRVPADRRIIVLAITFGSVIWMVLLAGVLFPDLGAFLLLLVPPQDVVPDHVIRIAMLAGSLVVPAIVGGLTVLLDRSDERSWRHIAESVARGYPLTVVLAILLVFLAVLSVWRKATSLARGRTDAHVPIVVSAGAYPQVATDLELALDAAGLDVTASAAPASMSKPAQWLAAVAGPGSRSLVPDRMIQLRNDDLDILIYPMDILISGRSDIVNRARAALASRLTTTAAHMTVSAEGQAIEDRLTALVRPPADGADKPGRYDDAAAATLEAIDRDLAAIAVPYEEWEVLYRQRLQVERDLRAGAMAGEGVLGAGAIEDAGPAETIARWLRTGTSAAADAITDDRTMEVVDRVAGRRWRWLARGVVVAVVALRDIVGSSRPEQSAGEPATFPVAGLAPAPPQAPSDDAAP